MTDSRIHDAERLAAEVRYHMESHLPLRFTGMESAFTSRRPVKPIWLILALLYSIFQVLLSAAYDAAEQKELNRKLTEELIREHLRKQRM